MPAKHTAELVRDGWLNVIAIRDGWLFRAAAVLAPHHGNLRARLRRFAFELGLSPELAVASLDDCAAFFRQALDEAVALSDVQEMNAIAQRLGFDAGSEEDWRTALRTSNRTTVLTAAEHDVFGDGSVVKRQARGHTEGHPVLYVKLANTGPVVLSGDLYHYPAERTLGRLPTFEVSEEETKAARAEVDPNPPRSSSNTP